MCFFSAVNLFQFLAINILDPDRYHIQPKMLVQDQNPESMNPDLKHWKEVCKFRR
jgi:hypothetical protein